METRDGPYHRLVVSDGLDQPGLSIGDNLARLADAPLHFVPGQAFRYSLGLDVVDAVIEASEGRSLGEVVRDLVTNPLDMNDTGFGVADPSRLATNYADGDPEPLAMTDGIAVPLYGASATFAPSRCLDPNSYHSGGAGMQGTADDVFTFLEAMRTGGDPILDRETVEWMMSDQVGPTAESLGPGWGFGYGWPVLADPAGSALPLAPGTLQWIGAYGHTWFIDRRKELTVLALTNTAFEGVVGRFPNELRNAIYGV